MSAAQAQTTNWTGATDQNFGNSTNWDAGVPNPATNADIIAPGAPIAYVVGTEQANGLLIGSTNLLAVLSGGSLTMTAGGVIDTNATISNNGALVFGSQLFVNGTLTSSGTISTNTGIAINSNGIVNNYGTFTSTVSNAGVFNNNANGTVSGLLTNTAGITTNGGKLSGGVSVSGGLVTNNNLISGTVDITGGQVDNNFIIAGAVNNAAIFNNNTIGTVSGLLTNSAGTTTNAGELSLGASVTGGTLNTTGLVAGGLTNTATVNAQGIVNGVINNNGSGIFNVTGSLSGDSGFNNAALAQLNVNAGIYAVGGLVDNSGTVVVAGGATLNATAGGLTNNAGGAVTVNGTLTGALNNAGTTTNNGSYSGNVVTNTGTVTNGAGATWNGDVISNASNATGVNNAGTWVGNVLANTGTVTNTNTWTGNITSSGILNNTAPGVIEGFVNNSGTATNSGTINNGLTNTAGMTTNTGTIAGGASVTGGTLISSNTITGPVGVSAGAFFDNNAPGTVSGLVTNAGTSTNSGTLSAGLSNSSGFTNSGTINAGASNSGTLGNSGTINGGIISNTGTINTTGTINDGVVNSGIFNASGTVSGTITNNSGGLFTATGPLTGNDTFLNTAGATLNVAGPTAVFNGITTLTNNGLVNVGANTLGVQTLAGTGTISVVTTAGQSSGGVNATVTSSGQQNVVYAAGTSIAPGGGSLVFTPIVTAPGTANIIIQPLSNGFFNFTPTHLGNQWGLNRSVGNGPGQTLGGIGATISTLASAFAQPASNFVSSKRGTAENAVQCGSWARGDAAKLNTNSTVTFSGGSDRQNVDQKLTYQGLQAGADCGVLNIASSGWNAHIGATGGQVDATAQRTDGPGSTDLSVPFVGAYLFATNGAATIDVSAVKHFEKAEFTNAVLGLNHKRVDGAATSVQGVASYRVDLGNNFYLTPAAGLTWFGTQLDDFDTSGGRVSAGKDYSLVGRAGAQAGYVLPITDTFVLQPFAGVSFWKNFHNESDLRFINSVGNASNIDATTTGVGSYTQFVGGLAFAESKLNAVGYIQGSWREGSSISGSAITAGGRINF